VNRTFANRINGSCRLTEAERSIGVLYRQGPAHPPVLIRSYAPPIVRTIRRATHRISRSTQARQANAASDDGPSSHRTGTYLASPIPTYGTARYDRIIALVRVMYPNELLLEPCHLLANHEEWRTRWPGIVGSIARLVFFANDDASLGAGVLRELHDARWQNVPIEFASDDGTLVSTYALEFTSADDPARVAFVVAQSGGAR